MLGCVLLGVAPLAAHEVGLERGIVDFPGDGSWHLAIGVDPMALLVPEAVARQTDPRPVWAGLAEDERRIRRERVRAMFADNLGVRFDDAAVPARVSIPAAEPVDDAVDALVDGIALSGRVPPGARAFSLAATSHLGPMLLIIRRPGGEPVTVALRSGGSTPPYRLDGKAEPGRLEAGLRFLAMGFTHIVPEGLDHILFVLGLFLLGAGLRPLLVQVTCFTVAHSLTLGLAWFGLVHVPARVIEPLIALSIVAVAVENLWARSLTPWRPFVVFAFGLVHGLGFADILRSPGLPRTDFATALVSFNLGVEAGQLTVIAVALVLTSGWRECAWYRARIAIPASLAIAAVGLVWSVQRVLG